MVEHYFLTALSESSLIPLAKSNCVASQIITGFIWPSPSLLVLILKRIGFDPTLVAVTTIFISRISVDTATTADLTELSVTLRKLSFSVEV